MACLKMPRENAAKMRIVAKMRMRIKKSCQCSITDSENSDDQCIPQQVKILDNVNLISW